MIKTCGCCDMSKMFTPVLVAQYPCQSLRHPDPPNTERGRKLNLCLLWCIDVTSHILLGVASPYGICRTFCTVFIESCCANNLRLVTWSALRRQECRNFLKTKAAKALLEELKGAAPEPEAASAAAGEQANIAQF